MKTGSYGSVNYHDTTEEGGFQEVVEEKQALLHRIGGMRMAAVCGLMLVSGSFLLMSSSERDVSSAVTSLTDMSFPGDLIMKWYVDPDSVDLVSDCNCGNDTEAAGATKALECTRYGLPALGGMDVVGYFNAHEQGYDYTNYTATNISDTTNYTSIYDGYEYFFESNENLELFEAAPEAYIPQYGGFCTYGIGLEYCNNGGWYWDAACRVLGPPSSMTTWMIKHDKLYFLYPSDTIMKFMYDNVYFDVIIASADMRWGQWFPDGNKYPANTGCYR
jgi:YHS domain-containing protein